MPEKKLIPLFPLGLVLLPDLPLPLHIFEERYKRMIGQCLEREQVFGVVAYTGTQIRSAGCTARLTEVLKRQSATDRSVADVMAAVKDTVPQLRRVDEDARHEALAQRIMDTIRRRGGKASILGIIAAEESYLERRTDNREMNAIVGSIMRLQAMRRVDLTGDPTRFTTVVTLTGA